MKIALVSLNQIWEDKKENLILCEAYMKEASDKKVDLIIFPEMTLTGFSTNIAETSEEEKNSETIKKFQDLSVFHDIAILFGVVVKDNKKALNKSIFIDNKGIILGKYSKIHPFSFAGEDKYFNAGNQLTVVKFKDIKIGLTICYDLRFPELYSAYAKECDILVNIANWPAKRIDHWNTLLKARAIENQTLVVGVNRTGCDDNGLEYIESSNLYNVNGDLELFENLKDMKIYNINKEFTKKFKNQFNTTNDRKIELYKEII
ncbi:carbon-nitrogen family hydrolase [Arcobacter sp. 15-2]|uniref:nitrilase-related carbon-nitrogen hydrolase n=1 Tax=Arcobacter sp. 15-2 TaxID=3374109 RepID=UPI00399C4F8B